MVAEFNTPLEAHLAEPPVEFVPPANQSLEVANQPPQVINEDSAAATPSGDGGTDEDDEVIKVDNPVGVLSSD